MPNQPFLAAPHIVLRLRHDERVINQKPRLSAGDVRARVDHQRGSKSVVRGIVSGTFT
jgi:hypothetical protein